MKRLNWDPGALQTFTPFCKALVTPDIDACLDDDQAKAEFWKAFRSLGEWFAGRTAVLACLRLRPAARDERTLLLNKTAVLTRRSAARRPVAGGGRFLWSGYDRICR